MKNITLLLTLLLLTACGSNNKKSSTTQTDKSIIKAYLEDMSSLEKVEGNAIIKFQEVAKKKAKMIIPLTKETIEEALAEAKEYKYCVITAGDHTIITITDLENCKPSGSWGAAMPMAKGYVKKGELTLIEDYANNIIGMPDEQVRIAFYFN